MKALDYTRASTYMQLCNDDFCSVPEFTGVAIRMGKKPPPVILGTLEDDPAADEEIAGWTRIACVLHDLKSARIGHFGHVLENMLDMQVDHTALTAAFGCHIVQTEPDDLMRHFRRVSSADAEAKKAQILGNIRHSRPEVRSDYAKADCGRSGHGGAGSRWRSKDLSKSASWTAWLTIMKASRIVRCVSL